MTQLMSISPPGRPLSATFAQFFVLVDVHLFRRQWVKRQKVQTWPVFMVYKGYMGYMGYMGGPPTP